MCSMCSIDTLQHDFNPNKKANWPRSMAQIKVLYLSQTFYKLSCHWTGLSGLVAWTKDGLIISFSFVSIGREMGLVDNGPLK